MNIKITIANFLFFSFLQKMALNWYHNWLSVHILTKNTPCASRRSETRGCFWNSSKSIVFSSSSAHMERNQWGNWLDHNVWKLTCMIVYNKIADGISWHSDYTPMNINCFNPFNRNDFYFHWESVVKYHDHTSLMQNRKASDHLRYAFAPTLPLLM